VHAGAAWLRSSGNLTTTLDPPFSIDSEAGTGIGGSLNVVGRLAGNVTFEDQTH